MTALRDELRRMIALEGPIPIDRYMALCLGHPRLGYYMTRDPLGLEGDFTTAPEISQMFGELIGLWTAQCWLDLGSPTSVRLVEFGPGRGTLMADALRAAKVLPEYLKALRIELVETSPVLRTMQAQRLDGCGAPVTWRSGVAELAGEDETSAPLLVVGNEFLDALPIRQFMRQDGVWRERLVGWRDDRLTLGLAAEPERGIPQQAPEGAVIEVAPAALALVRDLAALLRRHGGFALFVDYGYAKSGFGDTLQAMRRHAFVDPLAFPGDSDLTAHVDFDALGRAASAAGLVVHGPMEQGPFLTSLGLEARADQLIRSATSQDQADDIRSAERRLAEMTRTGMGRLFKAIAFSAPGQPPPPGFAT